MVCGVAASGALMVDGAGLATSGAIGAGGIGNTLMASFASNPAGWIALAAIAAYAIFAQKAGGAKSGGSFQGIFDETGKQTGTNPTNLFGLSSGESTGDAGVKALGLATAAAYYNLAGKDAKALTFGFGYDTDPNGKAENRVKGLVTDSSGGTLFRDWDRNIGRDSANIAPQLQLEASRALLAALQQSNLQKDMAKLFAGVVASTADQASLDKLFASAGDLKNVLDLLGTTTIPGLTLKGLRGLQLAGESLSATFIRVTAEFMAA